MEKDSELVENSSNLHSRERTVYVTAECILQTVFSPMRKSMKMVWPDNICPSLCTPRIPPMPWEHCRDSCAATNRCKAGVVRSAWSSDSAPFSVALGCVNSLLWVSFFLIYIMGVLAGCQELVSTECQFAPESSVETIRCYVNVFVRI